MFNLRMQLFRKGIIPRDLGNFLPHPLEQGLSFDQPRTEHSQRIESLGDDGQEFPVTCGTRKFRYRNSQAIGEAIPDQDPSTF